MGTLQILEAAFCQYSPNVQLKSLLVQLKPILGLYFKPIISFLIPSGKGEQFPVIFTYFHVKAFLIIPWLYKSIFFKTGHTVLAAALPVWVHWKDYSTVLPHNILTNTPGNSWALLSARCCCLTFSSFWLHILFCLVSHLLYCNWEVNCFPHTKCFLLAKLSCILLF